MKFEASSFEFDPSYDPERLDGNSEKSLDTQTSPSSAIPVVRVVLPEYIFDTSTNPFAWNAENQQPLTKVAHNIANALQQHFDMTDTIIRGVQSAHHQMPRDELIDLIVKNGPDVHNSPANNTEIFAQEFGDQAVSEIIRGFHVFKPKCDERPQHPVDIWMVFDKNSFESIEYLHPRHGVLARDKWRPVSPDGHDPRAVLVVN